VVDVRPHPFDGLLRDTPTDELAVPLGEQIRRFDSELEHKAIFPESPRQEKGYFLAKT
jgi:hypothetical protein